MASVPPDSTQPGPESVWAYPRPAIAEPSPRHIRIEHRGHIIGETRRAIRTLETSHPPSYYIPREDIDMSLLRRSARTSFCEWKGGAAYFDVVVDGDVLRDTAWSYPSPSPAFRSLLEHIAFYATPFDLCSVDGEVAIPQQGGFYGGWITSHVAGPFKGVPIAAFGRSSARQQS